MWRAALLLLGLLALPALAQDRVRVRVGDHPGHGRIVFDWAAPPAYQAEQQGERVLLRFPNAEAIDLAGARRLARNLLAVAAVPGGVELTLRPGARMRHFRNGPKVAIDLLDPTEASTAAAIAPARAAPRAAAAPPREAVPAPAEPVRVVAPDPSPAPQAAPVILRAAPVEPPPLPPALPSPPPVPVVAAPPVLVRPPTAAPPLASLAGPPPIRARLLDEPTLGPTMRLATGAGVGVAALRRGEQALLILDTDRPFEFGGLLREPAFAGIQAQALAGGTLVTWPLASAMQLALRQQGSDWHVSLVPRQHPAATAVPPLRIELENGRAILHAARPSRVITLNDPLTGVPLLVGTVVQPAPRQAVTRGMAELDLLETFLGVAVLARADRVALRTGAERFLLSVQGGGVALAGMPSDGQLGALGMTRSFDMPGQPVAALLERLRAQQAAVASAAPLMRGEPRLEAAQTLLALGLPQEAQAMLGLAAQENPQSAQDHRQAFLTGMAALLAGRPHEAAGLDAELPASDEIILWRGLRAAMQGDAQGAAAPLAATLPLLQSYPEGLRRRLLAVAAEALIDGGEPAAGRRVIEAAGEEPSLLLARAMLEEVSGQPARALEAYEAAAGSRDRLMRARALRRGVELRLATGRLDAAGAARALEGMLFAWRGDAQELATRERLAALRREAGDPRAALALLRETEAIFPEQAALLRAPIQAAFLQALEAEPPLGAVALYDAHPELLPGGEPGEAMLSLLTERLTALDLSERAAALLRRAMERQPPGEGRAALGARLATLLLEERDAQGALSALAASSAPRLSTALLEARSLLAARAEALRGNRLLAAEALRALGAAGDAALSEILAETQDFAGAAAAMGRYLASRLPPGREALTEPFQRLALRQAALLAMAGDEPGLGALRANFAPRMPPGQLAIALEALTTDPVRGLADLPRLARELNLFRSLPQRLEPLRTAQRPAG